MSIKVKEDDFQPNSQDKKPKVKEAKKSFDKNNSVGIYGTIGEPRKSLSTFLRNKNKSDISLSLIHI